MSSERNLVVSRQAHGTSAERIRRIDTPRAFYSELDADRIIYGLLGGSRPKNSTSAERLARISIMHEVQQSIDEQYSGAAAQYEQAETMSVGSQIPLRVGEDGTITYA